jgi:hypothetical protein
MRPHAEGPLWPPRGKQHDQSKYDDEEDRYNHQDRGIESLSPGVDTQDSSMSKRDGNGMRVAVPLRLTSSQDMGSRADFSFAEEPSPSPKQTYPVGISGADDGVATAIEVGKLTLVAHDEEEESRVEETATASLPAAIVIAKDEARLNNDGVARVSVTPDDDGPLYKSFRRRGGQATKNLSQGVQSPRASQSSKLEGESDEVESQSSHHSRQSSLSQRDRCIPHEQATSDRDHVDIESTQYTFGEDLSPNGYVDQLPIRMAPRDLSTTQGSITDPQHSQLPMRPPNVSRGGPNPSYGRGGLPQQGNGGPPSMRPLGRGRGVRPEAAMIRPPLEHNRYGMDVGQQGCAQFPPGNMLPNVMHSAQGPRRRPQRPLVPNQQGIRPMRPQVQNHQPTGPMPMRPGVRPPPMLCESDLQPSQAGKNVPNRVLQQVIFFC